MDQKFKQIPWLLPENLGDTKRTYSAEAWEITQALAGTLLSRVKASKSDRPFLDEYRGLWRRSSPYEGNIDCIVGNVRHNGEIKFGGYATFGATRSFGPFYHGYQWYRVVTWQHCDAKSPNRPEWRGYMKVCVPTPMLWCGELYLAPLAFYLSPLLMGLEPHLAVKYTRHFVE